MKGSGHGKVRTKYPEAPSSVKRALQQTVQLGQVC